MKDWIKSILGYIVTYALRFIIGFVVLIGIIYLLSALGLF